MPAYQPKTGQRCGCKPEVQRDNCPSCEGTGWVIDFAKIRARAMSQHTPGQWTVQPIGDETECNILGVGRELVATVSDNDSRLIAAAPALLKALEEMVEEATSAEVYDMRVPLAKARAAIAQARGKATPPA